MRIFIATIISVFLFTASAEAASLTLRNATEADQNTILIDVIADTSGTAINSIEATVQYPTDVLAFSGYQTSNGIVTFWIEKPHAQDGVIKFAGGIPGGVATDTSGGTELPLTRLVFTPARSGTADLSIISSTLLLNDGKGTALAHTTAGVQFVVPEKSSVGRDNTPPEPFVATLIPRDRLSGTPAMITFSAIDRESGIQSYKVRTSFGLWKEVKGAYAVRNTFFAHTVYVKAIDAYGNSTVTTVKVPGLIPIWVIFIVAAVGAASLWRFYMVKNKV